MTQDSTDVLLKQIETLRRENSALKQQVEANKEQGDLNKITHNGSSNFTLEEYKRYGRQMIVPMVGFQGQVKLQASKILVIGAGGLGCPALLYLAGAGIGKIGIVDNDIVDVSNLHRQVLHVTDNVGLTKCESARRYLSRLNPYVEFELFEERLTNSNVFEIFEKDDWDLVLDCTDTPLTRYLINDAAVICGKTIVSGSGVKTDGQLSLLNFANKGPCYRCFYPKPPPPNSVLSCKDGGVVGPAIGIMGTVMALEAIKVICGEYNEENFKPFLNMYTGAHNQTLRLFKMRGRLANCEACGENPIVTKERILDNEINYSEWCGKLDYDVCGPEERISVKNFKKLLTKEDVILDVRPVEGYNICHLPDSVHIPYDDLVNLEFVDSIIPPNTSGKVFCICRFGNDSRLAVRFLKEKFGLTEVYDVVGGLNKWSELVDPLFPTY